MLMPLAANDITERMERGEKIESSEDEALSFGPNWTFSGPENLAEKKSYKRSTSKVMLDQI